MEKLNKCCKCLRLNTVCDKMTQFEEMGKAFVGFYYPAFSENRGAGSQLLNVYTDQSCLSFEGAQFQGKQAIMGKWFLMLHPYLAQLKAGLSYAPFSLCF